MVKVYAVRTSKEDEMFYFNMVYPYLNTQRKNRIDSFLHVEDALRSLAGEWLTRLVLSEKLHVNFSEILIEHDKNGKPFYFPPSNIHFNVSHSGDWSVCALSSLPVGVDIEMVQPIDINIARVCFTENEYETMSGFVDISDQFNYFYDIWTIKESYLKATGSGFSKAPDSFGTEIINDQILLTGDFEPGYCFRQYNFEQGYKLSVCSLEKRFSQRVKICIPQ